MACSRLFTELGHMVTLIGKFGMIVAFIRFVVLMINGLAIPESEALRIRPLA